MSLSPYVNYWGYCVQLLKWSDKIGELNPKSPQHLALRCEYNLMEIKFYNRFIQHHDLEYPYHDKWWGQLVKYQNKNYAFVFKIIASHKRCEISFSTDKKLIAAFEKEIIDANNDRSNTNAPVTGTRNTRKRPSRNR